MRVAVVDDDKLVCASLKTILTSQGHIEVVGIGHSAPEAVALYEKHLPDVLLMDIRMGATTGLDAAEEILRRFPSAKILFLTTFSDDEYIIRALKAGVKGYLLKEDFESILPSLMAVHAGQNVFGTPIMQKMPSLLGEDKSPAADAVALGEKETQVLSLVAEGKNNREIAAQLYLSEGTVRNYISLLLEKLSLRNRTELAIYYYRSKS